MHRKKTAATDDRGAASSKPSSPLSKAAPRHPRHGRDGRPVFGRERARQTGASAREREGGRRSPRQHGPKAGAVDAAPRRTQGAAAARGRPARGPPAPTRFEAPRGPLESGLQADSDQSWLQDDSDQSWLRDDSDQSCGGVETAVERPPHRHPPFLQVRLSIGSESGGREGGERREGERASEREEERERASERASEKERMREGERGRERAREREREGGRERERESVIACLAVAYRTTT